MIVLWVVVEDLRFLDVIERPYELIDAKVFSPFFAVYEPSVFSQLTALDVADSTYICFARSTLNFRARRNLSY